MNNLLDAIRAALDLLNEMENDALYKGSAFGQRHRDTYYNLMDAYLAERQRQPSGYMARGSGSPRGYNPPDGGRHDVHRAVAEVQAHVEHEQEPGDWAMELGPLQQGDLELMEDAIDALEDLDDVQIQHALHGLTRRVTAARALMKG